MPRRPLLVAILLTGLYWVWESQASGNIRVDLLVIYPVLFATYLAALRPRFGHRAVPLALSGMALNVAFAVLSYPLFDKSLG